MGSINQYRALAKSAKKMLLRGLANFGKWARALLPSQEVMHCVAAASKGSRD
jgi:hypothetical protein